MWVLLLILYILPCLKLVDGIFAREEPFFMGKVEV
jgi:hypothetical protein